MTKNSLRAHISLNKAGADAMVALEGMMDATGPSETVRAGLRHLTNLAFLPGRFTYQSPGGRFQELARPDLTSYEIGLTVVRKHVHLTGRALDDLDVCEAAAKAGGVRTRSDVICLSLVELLKVAELWKIGVPVLYHGADMLRGQREGDIYTLFYKT